VGQQKKGVFMGIKRKLAAAIRHCPPLFKLGSKLYHTMNAGFKSLSPGAPGAIEWAFKKAAELHQGGPVGDYYEFGLYKGYTFFTAYRAAEQLGLSQTRFFGFDSFQGLPQVEDVDRAGGRFFKGQFACSRQQVEKSLLKNGVDFSRIRLIAGFYEETLTDELKKDLKAGPAGVILLDCDLYSSTSTALSWLEGLIADKTVVLFDDWYSFTEGEEYGQQRALAEFLQRNPSLKFEPEADYESNGRTFIVRSGV
jgi:O-methyltransferase